MSSSSDQQTRRRRRQQQQHGNGGTPTASSLLGSVVSVGTTALALYGAYQLASLAYEAWNENTDDKEKEDEEIVFENQTTPLQPRDTLEDNHFPTNRANMDEFTDNTAQTTSSSYSGTRSRQKTGSSLFWPFSTMISPRQNPLAAMDYNEQEPQNSESRHPYFVETESYLAEQSNQRSQEYPLPSVVSPHSTTGTTSIQRQPPRVELPPRPILGRRGRITPQTRQLMQHRGQDLKQCRSQVRQVLFRLIPTILKRKILEGTDFAKERRMLRDLRQEKQKLMQQPTTAENGSEEHAELNNNTTGVDQRLLALRDREKALWNIIQIQTLTRFIVTQYATSLLFVVLTVQVSVLLGEQRAASDTMALYENGMEQQLGENPVALALEDSKWILEQTYQYMFQHGLHSLLQTVNRSVSSEIAKAEASSSGMETNSSISEANWNVLDTLQTCPPSQIQQLMQRVDAKLRQDPTLDRDRSLLRFIQSPSIALMEDPSGELPQTNNPDSRQNERRTDLINETWDLLESPMVDDALQDTMMVLRYQMMERVFLREDGENGPGKNNQSLQNGGSELKPLPLAQMLTHVKKTCESFYATFTPQNEEDYEISNDAGSNVYLRALEHLPSVLEAMSVCYD